MSKVTLYKAGGPRVIWGEKYHIKTVDASEADRLIDNDGWCVSPQDAKIAANSGSVSREELEAEADRLDIGYNSRTSDETLKQRILDAHGDEYELD